MAAAVTKAQSFYTGMGTGMQNGGSQGVAVFVPEGVYKLTQSIEILQSNIVLRGAGVSRRGRSLLGDWLLLLLGGCCWRAAAAGLLLGAATSALAAMLFRGPLPSFPCRLTRPCCTSPRA